MRIQLSPLLVSFLEELSGGAKNRVLLDLIQQIEQESTQPAKLKRERKANDDAKFLFD
ncbi:MAG: hypothetical protein HN368_06615 [Spirochaetales bacterium]|jgi:hypothetical protein|nr:hypothetical protein [Spirochaetales bacterium]